MKPEIVVIIGYNSAGKTTLAQEYLAKGYFRINRDEIGGKLKDLPPLVEQAVASGHTNIVLDNTYRDVESRAGIVAIGKKLGIPVKCVWLDTSFEDAQYNACKRMVQKFGKLLGPEELAKSKNPNIFPPVALFSYRKQFQKPTVEEGFCEVVRVLFERRHDSAYCNKAVIFDYDGTLRTSKGDEDYPTDPKHVNILPGRKEKLAELVAQGYLLLGASNQSGVAKGKLSLETAVACFKKTNELLGQDIEFHFCPHNVPPVNCYCRKPASGLGVLMIERHLLSPKDCIFVGDAKTDATFAQRCGFQYFHPDDFFLRF